MKSCRILTGLALIGAMLTAGCVSVPSLSGPSEAGTPTIADPAPVTPTLSAPRETVGAPAVLIIDPPFDGGVLAGAVTVSVQVTDFALVPPGGPSRPGTGHLVYYRDVVPRTVPGETALTAPGTYSISSETAHTWEGITSGTHTFAVQLVNADDTPLEPPAIDAVDVTAVSSDMVYGTVKREI